MLSSLALSFSFYCFGIDLLFFSSLSLTLLKRNCTRFYTFELCSFFVRLSHFLVVQFSRTAFFAFAFLLCFRFASRVFVPSLATAYIVYHIIPILSTPFFIFFYVCYTCIFYALLNFFLLSYMHILHSFYPIF